MNKIDLIKKIMRPLAGFGAKQNQPEWVQPGHYYSSIPDYNEIRLNEQVIFNKNIIISDIDLNDERQIHLLNNFQRYYAEQPFHQIRGGGMRYFFENPSFSYADGLVLYSMIRYATPKRIIEVGGGFSTGLIADVNALFFDNEIHHTLVDPYPELAKQILGFQSKQTVLVPSKIQHVHLSLYDCLEENDILFIDSSHVAKIGSDVNHIFFHILPRLQKGVIVHFHDVFYPFEYPLDWVYQGRVWSEAYLLRAFLAYNSSFHIEFFNDYMATFFPKKLFGALPIAEKNTGGSIWIKKYELDHVS